MKTKQKNINTWDIVQKALLITNLTFLIIIIAFPLLSKTNHTSLEIYYLAIPLLITAISAVVLNFMVTLEKGKITSLIILASLLGIFLLYSYNRFNVLLNYDEWVNRGMPNRSQEMPKLLYDDADAKSDTKSSLKPQRLIKTSRLSNDNEIKDLIVSALQDEGVKGDIESEIKITKLESSALYENSQIELYSVTLGYAWLYSTYLVKDGAIVATQSGVDVFIADLDDDGTYEVYTNYSVGSGIVSDHISGYNIKTKESYVLGTRMENNVTASLKDLELVVRIEKYGDSADYKEEKLILVKKDGQTVLGTK